MENFEITEYDLENEFNINRPTRRISKHKQIYGKLEHYAASVLHLQVMITRFLTIHQYGYRARNLIKFLIHSRVIETFLCIHVAHNCIIILRYLG